MLRVACLPLVLLTAPAFGADGPRLDRTSVPADAASVAHVSLPQFGRFGIKVKSRQGVAIQIVDRVAGPGPVAGQIGETDGRIDRFFDRGTYRILTFGARGSEGNATLSVHPYRERNAPAPPKLVELRPIATTLGDFEQRSYWIDIPVKRTVAIEAAGRNLSDLRLWRDGTWLEDIKPNRETSEPTVGRPLTVMRLSATLEPGLYLLAAYGGPENPWAEEDGTHPLHLRFGIERLPSALRMRRTIGPFGFDRFIVDGADYFRIELAVAQSLSMDIHRYDEARPFDGSYERRLVIDKKTNPPIADTVTGARHVAYVLTVRGARDLPYVLQHFAADAQPKLRRGSSYVSTIHSGTPGDAIDASGIIIEGTGRHRRAAMWQAAELSSDRGLSRRFNLLGVVTLYLDVTEPGSYRIDAGGGARARFRVEPFLLSKPKDYKTPDPKTSGQSWALDRGLYVLTILPSKNGVLEFAMGRTGFFQRVLSSGPQRELPRPSVTYEAYEANTSRTLMLSAQANVRAGIVQRALPVDLREALPVAMRPGIFTIRASVEEEGVLFAETDVGERLQMSVDGGPWASSHHPSVGPHDIRVKNAEKGIAVLALGLRVRSRDPDTPLPPLPDGRLAKLPKYETLTPAKPTFLDLDRTSTRSYLVDAKKPGLYRLESTGVLATSGNLRTRTVTSLARASQNGLGRNFLVQQYLGAGDYQVTVATEGRTRGHLGVRLKRTPENDGGELLDGVPARTTLRASETIVYRFRVEKTGTYRLRSFGRGRRLRGRLEDAEGWPLLAPGIQVDVTRQFEPGVYRLVVLPESVDVRVVTKLERSKQPVAFEGHGPHRLTIGQATEHVWVLDEGKKDEWTFEVPADVDARIELSGKMHGDLFRIGEDGKETKAAYVPPLRGWSGPLALGLYRMRLTNLHRTTQVPYTIAVRSQQMTVGRQRVVSAPAEVPIAIGQTGLVEMSSFGDTDVEARLFDAEGTLVARSDDRPDDWNFFVAHRTTPGRYTLRIDPVGPRRASTMVNLKTRSEDIESAVSAPARKTLRIAANRKVFPLKLSRDARFLAVTAESAEMVGLVVSEQNGREWSPIAHHVGRPARIAVPLPATEGPYRLELWSIDERNSPIHLSVQTPKPRRFDEARLASGVTIPRASGVDLAIAEVELDRPGTFRVTDADEVMWTGRAGRITTPPRRGLAHPSGTSMWLVRPVSGRTTTVHAARVRMSGGSLALSIADEPVDVDIASDRMVVATVTAPKAPAGIAVGDGQTSSAPTSFDVRDGGAATAVHLGGDARVRLWAASSATRFDALLRVHRFEPPRPRRIHGGRANGTIAPGGAAELSLVGGLQRFDVALQEGGVIAIANDHAIERVLVATDSLVRIESTGTRLLLFNPNARETAFAVTALSIFKREALVESPYEVHQIERGRTELFVPAGSGNRTLELRGVTSSLFIDDVGGVHTGRSIPIGARGGLVRVRHEPGLVAAWIENESKTGLFAKRPQREQTVTTPLRASLKSTMQVYRVAAEKPTLFVARFDTPVVARWVTKASSGRPILAPTTGVPLYLPSGEGRLWVRAVGGGDLHGTITLTAVDVVELGEGVGPEVMVAPAHPRAFVFEVDRKRRIGVGVRAGSASVRAELRRVGHGVVGNGVVQMHDLEPGTYVFVLDTPANGTPSQARPAVVGLDPPPTGPPEDILRTYLSAAGYEEQR